ncbi:hypothetical protein O3P69_002086 [Scylla paramamosain]|uniref:CUB domain-containing protein n=3 Tax=Scylla paramamosain TaxID=85552 RepID=A0AAW0V853_SCYPA
METVLCALLVCASVCVAAGQDPDSYDRSDLSEFRLCGHNKESGSIYIRPSKAAILTFGNPPGSKQPPPGRSIHECVISITTRENFSLSAVVEEMSIAATHNKKTHGWECDGDYLKISTVGTSLFSKLLNIIPGDFFRSKKTDKLCGMRKGKPRFSEVGSNADVFSTIANNMEVMFHQSDSKSSPVDNYFRIVITSFKYVKNAGDACQGMYHCRGSENYCIGKEYVCDTHYNCAGPRGGGDESRCEVPGFTNKIFSTTTTIITSLASIVGAAFLLGCIITLGKKMRSQSSSQSRSVTPRAGRLSEMSDPPLQRQHTLPPYEAVVMADADPSWKSSNPESPGTGELPPKYESLFPDGPPIPTDHTPTAPSIGNNQQEQSPHTASSPGGES